MKKNLIIDIIALVVYLVVANPVLTGIDIHEWLGLGVFVVFLVHVIMHFDWIVDTSKGLMTSPSWARQGNLIVDVLTLIMFIVVFVSGLGVSGAVLPAFGLYADGYYFWDPLHLISAKVLLALIVIHMVVHWKWIFALFKKDKEEHDE